jgi:hypothetical protein
MLTTQFEPRASRLLRGLVLAATLAALVAIGIAALAPAVRFGAGALVIAVFAAWLRAQRRPLPALAIDAGGTLRVRGADGSWQPAVVLPESFVAVTWCVVRLALPDGRRIALTLLPDSAPPDALRRLRVLLRWGAHTRSDTRSPAAG